MNQIDHEIDEISVTKKNENEISGNTLIDLGLEAGKETEKCSFPAQFKDK